MIVLDKFFPGGCVLAYILSLFLLIVTRVIIGNNLLQRKSFLYIYIISLSIFFIQININANKINYFNEFCLKDYILNLERKQCNNYVILNTYPNNDYLIGTIVHFDNYEKHQNKYIRISCQLVSHESKILLKNVRIHKIEEGFWVAIKSFLIDRFPNNSHGSLACGIILGDSRFIEKSKIKSFKEAGVLHLFAVSGLHIGFMYLLVRLFCSFLLFKKLLGELVGLLGAGIYVIIVGFPDSAIRAWLMLFIFLLFSVLLRKKNPMNALLLSGLIILFIDNESLFSVGFQLSYIIVSGIIWVFKSNSTGMFNKCFFSYCINVFKLTLTCSFASCFLLIDYFDHFPALSFITNFLIQPIIFLFFSISFFSIIIQSNILSTLLDYIYLYVTFICDFFASINSVIVGSLPIDVNDYVHLVLFSFFILSYHLKLNQNHRFLIICSFYMLTLFEFVIFPFLKK